jgi:glycerol-3-phosphate cytidylyltransferase-like family protein
MSKVTQYEDIMQKVKYCDCIIINKINSLTDRCANISPDVYERLVKPVIDNNQTAIMFCDLNDKGNFFGGEYVSKNANTSWTQSRIDKDTRVFKNKKLDYSNMPSAVAYKIIATAEQRKEVIISLKYDEIIQPEKDNVEATMETLFNQFVSGKDSVLYTDLKDYLLKKKDYDIGTIRNFLSDKVLAGDIENPDGKGKKWITIKISKHHQSGDKFSASADNQDTSETVWMA